MQATKSRKRPARSPKVYAWRGDLNVTQANDLRQSLCEQLAQTTPLEIDCAELTSCDATVMQLMLASAKKRSETDSGESSAVIWNRLDPAVVVQLRQFGVYESLRRLGAITGNDRSS